MIYEFICFRNNLEDGRGRGADEAQLVLRNRVMRIWGFIILFLIFLSLLIYFDSGAVVKSLPVNAEDGHERQRFDPWVGKISWSRKWQPTPVFLLGKSYGQRCLAGLSARGLKESDKTEHSDAWVFIDHAVHGLSSCGLGS